MHIKRWKLDQRESRFLKQLPVDKSMLCLAGLDVCLCATDKERRLWKWESISQGSKAACNMCVENTAGMKKELYQSSYYLLNLMQ